MPIHVFMGRAESLTCFRYSFQLTLLCRYTAGHYSDLYSSPDKYDRCDGEWGELPCRQTMQAALRLRVQFATNLHLPTFQLL